MNFFYRVTEINEPEKTTVATGAVTEEDDKVKAKST